MDNNTQTTDPQDVEGTWGPVSDVLRRNAEYMKAVGRNLWRDPVGTYFPHAGSVGAALKEIPAFVSDLAPRNNNVPGNSYFTPNNPRVDLPSPSDVGPGRRYVDFNDKLLHKTMPGYIPRRDITWRPPLPPGM